MTQHLTDEELVLHHYGEDSFAPHLDECGECRRRLEELARTLSLAAAREVPEPEAGYERSIWRAIAPRIDSSRGRPAAWRVWGGAAAALLAVAFLAGRWTARFPAPAPVASAIPPAISLDARQRVFEASVAGHLDRAHIMLAQLAVDPSAAPEDTLADIAAASRLYRLAANRLNQPGLALLLEDVELVFVEAAHQPPQERDALRRRLQRNDLPFQVQAVQALLAQRFPAGSY
jgi:predicted anti-sigma-YlaC factor YlaD